MGGDGNQEIQVGIMFKYIILLLFIFNITLFALSKEERIIKNSLYPYTVKGVRYYPHKVAIGQTKTILASWYGEYFHGRKTANGEIYDMYGYTAAHKTYPLGTVLLVTNPKNQKSLEVRINDRGPFWNDRELDLSMGAAEYLGTKREGVATVDIEIISVPPIALTFKPTESKEPLEPKYNIGYSAMSYATVNRSMKRVLFEIGNFDTKREANLYLKKFKKYKKGAKIKYENYSYKVEFYLPSNENKAIKELKRLKRKGLITGHGICWSYE